MTDHALSDLRRRISSVLGPDTDRVLGPAPGHANVSGFATRDTLAVLRPTRAEQVPALLRALDDADAPSLYAVSTGRNWGLGSREPVGDGAVRLELHGLDRVRRVDTDAGWAVIETGVTQRQLSEQLAGTGRMLNVTASSAHTSVLGNALDRGVGLRRQRVHDLVGLEVVLPGGEVARVGWWPGEGGGAPNPHGLGPSPLHLFTQSDLGVAVAGVVRLPVRPEVQRVLRLTFGPADLGAAVDVFRRWQGQGLFQGVLKVYDTTSASSYGTAASSGYLAHLSVGGTAESVEALLAVLAAEAEAAKLFTSVLRSDQDPPEPSDVVSRVVEAGYAGDVSHHEEMLRSAVGRSAADVDTLGGGWIFFLPLVPYTGRDVTAALALLDWVHARTGLRPGATVNALDPDVVDLVVSLRFDRSDPDETERAHLGLDLLHESFASAGYLPYRLDVDHASRTDFLGDPASRALIRTIRTALDPRDVIARGRYS
ncbi:FAD-binding oxidoreductase [Nocardiopsis sp. M1B1]|uniref:FAD-binding oxidoreductase n=1 Tax=Nocardiopsis sp. M1B1 TaxID=3450454 RepID=UPI00403A7348